ncbi:hypothetical protein ACRAWD_31275 [Caulobacter segnis]
MLRGEPHDQPALSQVRGGRRRHGRLDRRGDPDPGPQGPRPGRGRADRVRRDRHGRGQRGRPFRIQFLNGLLGVDEIDFIKKTQGDLQAGHPVPRLGPFGRDDTSTVRRLRSADRRRGLPSTTGCV